MHEMILCTISSYFIQIQVVFLTSQTNEAIIIQKNCQWINYWGDKNIYSKIKLVTINECGMFDVFLNNVGIVLFYCLGWFSDLIMIGNS